MGKSILQIFRNPPWKQEAPPCHQGFHLLSEEKHQKQNRQQVGRNKTVTKYCREGLQAGMWCGKTAADGWQFQMEFSSYAVVEVNEMSAQESSADELKVNKVLSCPGLIFGY